MTSRPRWVRYSARKVPLTTAGRPASATNAATWTTFGRASSARAGVGAGFVLNGDGIVCLDLDHCLTAGKPSESAQRLLGRLPRTYVEVSPSGDGLHVWGRGSLSSGRVLRHGDLNVEVYGAGRYITVTARPFRGSTSRLADLSDVLTDLLS